MAADTELYVISVAHRRNLSGTPDQYGRGRRYTQSRRYVGLADLQVPGEPDGSRSGCPPMAPRIRFQAKTAPTPATARCSRTKSGDLHRRTDPMTLPLPGPSIRDVLREA